MSTDQILKEVMALPADEKAKLAEQLLASLDAEASVEIERLWREEAERRIDAFEAGEITAEPAEDVIKALRERKR
jgi:putative addiction module component (TIGR02574 family)